jgi:membrane protein implicated in regulation of membrane protease activity
MIHIAILVVLVIIAFVIAPWLIGVVIAVVVAMAAAYGVYIFVVAALAGSVLAFIGIWYLFKWLTHRKTPLAERGAAIAGKERINCKHCQADMPANLLFCDNCHNKL